MTRTMKAALAVLVLAAVLVSATGCTRVKLADDPKTKVFTESGSIAVESTSALKLSVEQGVGELTMNASDATTSAIGTQFIFSPESWRPTVTTTTEGSATAVSISQAQNGESTWFNEPRNEWTVSLPKGLPTDLSLQLGVGKSLVDLREVDLRNLDVQNGVGSTTIDLTGTRTADVSASIQCGVGELTLRLPKGIGVRVRGADDGIGDVSADGFITSGGTWTNAAYSGSGPKIEIDLSRGVGDVTLVLVD